MSESKPEPTPTEPQEGTPEPEPKSFDADYVANLRKEAAKYRTEAKAATEQLSAIQQANESALEKAQRQAQEYQVEAQRAGTEALRERIAREAGIADNVDLILTGPDEDTMRRQAQLWSERAPAAGTSPAPRPDLSQGTRAAPATGDPAQDFANFMKRQLT